MNVYVFWCMSEYQLGFLVFSCFISSEGLQSKKFMKNFCEWKSGIYFEWIYFRFGNWIVGKKLEEDVAVIKNMLFLIQKSHSIVVKHSKCSMFLSSFVFRKAWPCLIWFLKLFLHCEWDAGGTAFNKRIAAKWDLTGGGVQIVEVSFMWVHFKYLNGCLWFWKPGPQHRQIISNEWL